MRIGVMQLAARWGRIDAAVDRADRLLAAETTDLVLLPEAALTGYVSPQLDFDCTPFAESEEGPLTHALRGLARQHRTCVVGPRVLRAGDAVSNELIAFDGEGQERTRYAKRHPWYPETWATPGLAPYPRWTFGGLRITLALCFDLHFLADEAADTLRWADLLLFASAWVDETDSRVPQLCALAAEHRLWIANANWCGGDVEIPGQGASCIVDPSGRVVVRAGHDECMAVAEVG